jgi:hypothetical protein
VAQEDSFVAMGWVMDWVMGWVMDWVMGWVMGWVTERAVLFAVSPVGLVSELEWVSPVELGLELGLELGVELE